jgi:hypothetical protein
MMRNQAQELGEMNNASICGPRRIDEMANDSGSCEVLCELAVQETDVVPRVSHAQQAVDLKESLLL